MDITNESLKTMKAKQLRRIIREAITEVLNEETFAGKNAVADLKSEISAMEMRIIKAIHEIGK